MTKNIHKDQILKNINTYSQLIAIFEVQKDFEAMERSKANLLKFKNLLKECK